MEIERRKQATPSEVQDSWQSSSIFTSVWHLQTLYSREVQNYFQRQASQLEFKTRVIFFMQAPIGSPPYQETKKCERQRSLTCPNLFNYPTYSTL